MLLMFNVVLPVLVRVTVFAGLVAPRATVPHVRVEGVTVTGGPVTEELTVRLRVVVLVSDPEVPVMVTVTVPVAAVALAVNVSVLVVLVGLGLKPAVTPLGRPEAERVTLPLKPPDGVTVIVLVPWLPCVTARELGFAPSEKLGAVTVRLTVVVLVSDPEVPVMVTVTVPAAALALAVNVSVLVVLVGLGLKAAVTPLGRPEAERVTLPLKPPDGVTVIVLVPLAPCAIVSELGLALSENPVTGVPTRALIRAAPLGLPSQCLDRSRRLRRSRYSRP